MSEEIIGNDNGKASVDDKNKEVTDFKICEIWIHAGQIHLDAVESFWADRVRAIGVFEVCKDIIRNAKPPASEKEKIITGSGVIDFVRNGFRKKRGK